MFLKHLSPNSRGVLASSPGGEGLHGVVVLPNFNKLGTMPDVVRRRNPGLLSVPFVEVVNLAFPLAGVGTSPHKGVPFLLEFDCLVLERTNVALLPKPNEGKNILRMGR